MTSIDPVIALSPSTTTGSRLQARLAGAALPILFLMVWGWSLSRSLCDPIGFDQAMYQYMAERVMAGDRLYVEIWDQNTPGIVGIHYLSTWLVGRSPLALRTFDAIWQMATLLALFAVTRQVTRRSSAAWLAVLLYVLAYYGCGYIHTAQREGFAVLPLLLATWLLNAGREKRFPHYRSRSPSLSEPQTGGNAKPLSPAYKGGAKGGFSATISFPLAAGACAFTAFAIKPPLGLCFAVLWLQSAARAWTPLPRRISLLPTFALGVGFITTAVAGAMMLIRIGSWEAFWPTFLRSDVPGYIQGPALLRQLVPGLNAGILLLALPTLWLLARGALPRLTVIRCFLAASILLAIVLSLWQWPAWYAVAPRIGGLLLPALAAMLLADWSSRSPAWRTVTWMTVAGGTAVVLQGHFYLYHCFPLLAFSAIVVAAELAERFACGPNRCAWSFWTVVCLAGCLQFGIYHWDRTLSLAGRSPLLFAGTTLNAHYTRITRSKTSFPAWATTAAAAGHIRATTSPSEAIACLIDEPRLYYLSQRRPVFRLLRTQHVYATLFPGYMSAIQQRRPAVIAARIPQAFSKSTDPIAVETAVFDAIQSQFGPAARFVREKYRLAETFGEIALLTPGPANRRSPERKRGGSEP